MISRIKLIRKNAGVTQSEFAEVLGLSRSMISQVEAGMQVFSDRSLRDICRIYGVNEDWLRTGEGEPYAPKSRNEIIVKMEEAAKNTKGVKNAIVNFMMLKMDVEFEDNYDTNEVMKDVIKNCKKVEDDMEIYL